MSPVAWHEVAEYVAAGNLVNINVENDLVTVRIDVYYLNIRGSETFEADIKIVCQGCCYIDSRRTDHHTPGSGAILEAYLHTESPLIDNLHAHKLDSRAGCLALEDQTNGVEVQHLELIGDISLNILCEDISFTLTGPKATPSTTSR